MTAVRHPLIDLVMNDETSRYTGHIERKLVKFTLEDLKMRALLELLTGNMWDDTDFHKMTDDQLQEIAVDTLKRRLQLSDADARAIVADRWTKANPTPPDPNDIKSRQFLFGPSVDKAKVPHNVVVSRPLGGKTTPPHYNVQKHLEGLERAAKNREAMRDQV